MRTPPGAAVLTVKKDGSGQFATIHSAIEAANSFDEIRIGPGLYSDWIHLTKPGTVVTGTDREDCVVRLTRRWDHEGLWASDSAGAESPTIRNLTLVSGSSSVDDEVGLRIENCTVRSEGSSPHFIRTSSFRSTRFIDSTILDAMFEVRGPRQVLFEDCTLTMTGTQFGGEVVVSESNVILAGTQWGPGMWIGAITQAAATACRFHVAPAAPKAHWGLKEVDMNNRIPTEPARATSLTGPRIVLPTEGESFDFGGLGVDWKIDHAETGGGFSVVHHPIAPRALAAPLHRHANEDEYSFVLEGKLGALLGDDVVVAGPGTWVFKPRNQWHTFWNAGDDTCRVIEIISPGGFEDYFRQVAANWGDLEAFARINAAFDLEMDFESVPKLCQRFGLTFPEL